MHELGDPLNYVETSTRKYIDNDKFLFKFNYD